MVTTFITLPVALSSACCPTLMSGTCTTQKYSTMYIKTIWGNYVTVKRQILKAREPLERDREREKGAVLTCINHPHINTLTHINLSTHTDM